MRCRTHECCEDVAVPQEAPYPEPFPRPRALDEVAEVLDPVLTALGFAPALGGATDTHGQVIFCRGDADSADGGCVDLVLDLDANPAWRIIDVRYWGFPSDRWHLDFDAGADLALQLSKLARSLPITLA
jgi:hypothetical protein